jgi:polar amino acid transport system permease protein
MSELLWNLLLGLPGQRPGGLVLSVVSAVAAGGAALVVGLLYATVCVSRPGLSLTLQAPLAVLRGVPLLLLIFALAQVTGLPLVTTGFLALMLYSLSHVGETLRSYLAAYPGALREQARLLTVSPLREWLALRIPWTFRKSLDALGTHWVSLLKDTGALTILGIGELTTVARLLGEHATTSRWALVLGTAAALYLVTLLGLMGLLSVLKTRLTGSELLR